MKTMYFLLFLSIWYLSMNVAVVQMQQLTKNVALDPEQRKRTVRVLLPIRPSVGHPGV
jgi:hypothetical protein